MQHWMDFAMVKQLAEVDARHRAEAAQMPPLGTIVRPHLYGSARWMGRRLVSAGRALENRAQRPVLERYGDLRSSGA